MKKYIGILFSVIVLVALVFALAYAELEPVDVLLRPPKNKGQNSDIQSAFEECINGKYVLKSPLSGKYKSSFILADFDSDKDNEVVVFYSLSDTPDVARINIIDCINGKWRSISDFESGHNQVQRVDFSDIDKDGTREIIVGWSISDSEFINTLDVYKIKYDSDITFVEKIFESNYTEYTICDINSDFKDDILIFDRFYTDNSSIRATYIDFGDYDAKSSGEFLLDPIISSVYSVCSDKDKSNGNTRIYVDGYRKDGGMTTELFFWDNKENRFKASESKDSTAISVLATRNTVITCRDINDDGIIEIPFEEYINDSKVVSLAKSLGKQQSIINWVKSTGTGPVTVYYEIFNQNNYSLKINKEWYGYFTVKNDEDKSVLTFYAVENAQENLPFGSDDRSDRADDIFDFHFNDGNENENVLFSILSVLENENNFYDLSGYKFLKNDNGYSYFCYIYKEGKRWGITKDFLKKMLITRGDGQ